jgi:hypothetical protein
MLEGTLFLEILSEEPGLVGCDADGREYNSEGLS